MKARITLIMFLFMSQLLFANNLSQHDMMQQKIINETITNIYDDFQANVFTCINVVKLSKGKVSKEECEKHLSSTNKECATLAKENIKTVLSQNDALNLMDILVSCPVIKMMGKKYEIIDGKPVYNIKMN